MQDCTTIVVLEIERDRLLSAVLGEEGCTHQSRIQLFVGAELTREIAGPRHFDLDDLCSELSQLVCAKRPGEHIRQIQDASAFKGRFSRRRIGFSANGLYSRSR